MLRGEQRFGCRKQALKLCLRRALDIEWVELEGIGTRLQALIVKQPIEFVLTRAAQQLVGAISSQARRVGVVVNLRARAEVVASTVWTKAVAEGKLACVLHKTMCSRKKDRTE